MDFIILGIKFILQQSGVDIKPAEDKDGKYARLTEYVFPHNRFVKLIIYTAILKCFRGNYNLIAMLTNLVDKTCFFI